MILFETIKILSILHVANGMRSYTIEFVSYEQKYRSEFYSLLSFQLVKIADRTVFNGSAIMTRDISDMVLTVTANALQSQKAKPYKWLDYTVDVCDLLDKSRKRPLNILYHIQEAVARSGHLLPEKCPYKKGEDYYVKNLYMDAETFPSHVPEMVVKLNFVIKHRQIVFFDGNLTVAIESKRSKKKTLLKRN